MIKHIFRLCILISISSAVFAGDPGSTGAAFLKINPSAQLTGMGGVSVSLDKIGEGVFCNPASTASLRGIGFGVNYAIWFQGMNYFNMSGTMELGSIGTVGAGIIGMMYGDIPVTILEGTEYKNTGETIAVGDYALSLSYGKKLFGILAVGVSLKTVSQKLENESSLNFGINSGILIDPDGSPWGIGISVENMGLGKVTFISTGYPLPMRLKAGGHYMFSPADRHSIIISADMNIPNDDALFVNLGLEYSFAKFLFLRGGNQIGGDVPGLKAGAGIKINNYGLDYAFDILPDIGMIHRIGLNIEFGSAADNTDIDI